MPLSFTQRGPYHDRTTPAIDAPTATSWDQTLADLVAAANGALALSGGTLTGDLLLAGDPSAPLQAATRQYVDAARSGLDVKLSVRAATTANISLTGTQTIDGIALIAGDRVLVKDQVSGAQNGLWSVSSGAWSRTTDADADPEVTAGLFTFVESGTTNHDTGWVLQTDNPITVDTTALSFAKFSSAASSSGVGSVAGVSPNAPGGNVALVAGTNVTITPDDASDTVTIAASGGGGGGSSNGTFPAPVLKTANYTATSSDHLIEVDASGGAVTITIPTAVGIPGKQYYVVKVDASSNLVTLATTSSQTINGLTTRSTNFQWDILGAESDNANWVGITSQDAADSYTEINLSVPDVLQVGVGTARYYLSKAKIISSVRASVGTAPNGAAILVDVNKNGTTIFTTQANRPSIAVSTFTALAPAIDVTSLVAGDYLTVDVDQVGSTVAGSDLAIQIGFA